MKVILCVFTLAILSGCGPYEFRSIPMSKKTRRIVNEIAKKNTLDAAAVGIAGGRSEQFKNFMLLSKKATKEEIIGLTNHPNGVVRAYAMWAIVEDTTINPIPILSKHLHDYEEINYLVGCVGRKETVGTMMFEMAISMYGYRSGEKKFNRVSYQIDSMLLSSKTELSVRNDVISRLPVDEKNYSFIRHLATAEYNENAIQLLASYQKEEDVDFLLSYIKLHKDNDYTLCKMIEIFPHELFFPYVLELSDKHIETKGKICLQENCLLALASYRNNKAKEIFTKKSTEAQQQFQFYSGFQKEIPGIEFNGETGDNSLYTVLNCRFPAHPDAEMMLFNLDIAGIAASGGSACSSGSNQGSHVLRGIGADVSRASVRFSFCKYTTKEEIDYTIEKLKEMLK